MDTSSEKVWLRKAFRLFGQFEHPGHFVLYVLPIHRNCPLQRMLSWRLKAFVPSENLTLHVRSNWMLFSGFRSPGKM
jgi:hypothetical protein